MKETASFYSEFLARFVSVVLEDEVVQQVELEPHSRPNNLQSAKQAVQALERYLRGENVDLSTFPVDLENRSVFERAVLECARQISPGSVVTYSEPVSYTHLRAHETDSYLVCRLLLEKKKKNR